MMYMSRPSSSVSKMPFSTKRSIASSNDVPYFSEYTSVIMIFISMYVCSGY